MSDQSDLIDSINKKLALARNLVWVLGTLLAVTVAAVGYAASQWQSLTDSFVKHCDVVVLENLAFAGRDLHANRQDDQDIMLLQQHYEANPDPHQESSKWILISTSRGEC